MGRLAGFKADEMIRKLRRAGFVFDRQRKGSHQIWRNPETGRRTTVPRHPGELPVPKGVFRSYPVRRFGALLDLLAPAG